MGYEYDSLEDDSRNVKEDKAIVQFQRKMTQFTMDQLKMRVEGQKIFNQNLDQIAENIKVYEEYAAAERERMDNWKEDESEFIVKSFKAKK